MRRVIGPRSSTRCPSSVWSFMTLAHALVDDHLADYVGAQRPQDVGSVAQLPRSEVNLVEWVHGDSRQDLEGPVDVAAPQQVVDGLGAGGVGPLRISRPVGEEVAELGVRQDAAVPVRSDLNRVLRFHVGSRRVIA